MSIFPHLIYRLSAIPIKVPVVFAEMNKQIQKFIWKGNGTTRSKTNFMKNEVAGFTLLEGYSNQDSVTLDKGQTYRSDGLEWKSLEIYPHIRRQLTFDKGAKGSSTEKK